MSTFVKTKHDIGLLRQDGSTKVGLRLAKDKDGNPIYRTVDDEYLSYQMFTGTPGYGNLPPEKELAIRQDDWRSGFGLEYCDADDSKRYYSSIGMDMRYRGMAVAGPVATAITKPSVAEPSITNADMELDSDWTHTGTGSAARSNEQKKTGTYSWKVTTGPTTNNISRAYQDLASYSKGAEYTLTCWALRNMANLEVRIGLDDGVTESLSDSATNSGVFEQLSIAKTLSVNATQLRVVLYCKVLENVARSGYFDDAAISATALTIGTTVAFADFNDELYASFGANLAKLNAGGTTFDLVAVLAATITDLEPFTDNNLYIAIGNSAEYWYMDTSEDFTESTLTENMEFFHRVDAAAPTMWGNYSVYQIKSASDPTNAGAWAADTTVDSSYHDITSLLSKSGALYIMKEDMPYYLNSAGAVQNDLAPELKSGTCSTSGKNAFLWKNKLYIPFGTQGLLGTDGTTNTFLNPASYCTNLSDFVGRVFAVAGDEEYLFVAVDNSTKIEIIAGREETIDSTTGWVWHPILDLTLAGCETLYVSSVYQKRLWIASTDSSDSLYYIPLPTGYGDIENDANRSFQTDSYMITPWLHGNFKADNKAFIKIITELGHSYDADIYFECHYEILGDTAWTDAGDLKGTATDRTATLYIPADASGNNPVSEMIRFKFVVKTDDTQKTPILLGYDVRAILYPTNRRIIECEVLCDDELTLKDSTIEHGQAATIKATLEEARNATWPVTFYPLDWESSSDTIYVKFLPLQTAVTKKEKGRGTERHYLLRLQEVALS